MSDIKEHKIYRQFMRFCSSVKKILKSMKLRIFIIIVIVGIIPTIIFRTVLQNPIENEMVASKMDRLLSQCNLLKNHIISENYMEFRESASIDAELSQLSAMYDGRVMLINTDFRIIKDTYIMDENKTSVSKDVIRGYNGESITRYDSKKKYIEIVLPLATDSKQTAGVMFVTFSTKDVSYALENIAEKMVLIQVILAFVIILLAVFWSRHLVKPFHKIENSFDKVSYGYFDNKLSLDGYTETDKIAAAYNDMLDKMKQLDESRQEFVSNVSHELKTPITSIKVLADSLMMQEDVPNEIYKEFFSDIVMEIDRENEIITDLLTLVRLDKKNGNLNIASVNINEMVE